MGEGSVQILYFAKREKEGRKEGKKEGKEGGRREGRKKNKREGEREKRRRERGMKPIKYIPSLPKSYQDLKSDIKLKLFHKIEKRN